MNPFKQIISNFKLLFNNDFIIQTKKNLTQQIHSIDFNQIYPFLLLWILFEHQLTYNKLDTGSYYIIIQYSAPFPNPQIMLDKFLKRPLKQTANNEVLMDIENEESEQMVPWVQKYRPQSLSELSYQNQVVSALQNVTNTGNVPHLLFYGPAGTGKTSAILAMSKQLFGPKNYRSRILQLNASDQRGINVVRQKVKQFATKAVSNQKDKNYISPKIKIIILDEADLLTNDAQSALRRIIEDNSGTTRFCIICNYITKIIQPLASRCIKFRFKSIPSQVQFTKLEQICIKQKISLNRTHLNLLVEKGDLRQSINSLQSLSKLSEISEYILPVSRQKCTLVFNDILDCTSIAQAYQLGKNIGYQGYAIDQILTGFLREIQNSVRIPNQKVKAILLEHLSECNQHLENGASQLPLIDLFTTIYYVANLQM